MSSVMLSRLMLNLRDPNFISGSERNASENTTYPDLTFVESHYPTQFSDRDDFAESESRGRDEAWAADPDLCLPAVSGKHLVSSSLSLICVTVFLIPMNFLGRDMREFHKTSV